MHFYLIFHELKITYEKRTFSLHTHTLFRFLESTRNLYLCCVEKRKKRDLFKLV